MRRLRGYGRWGLSGGLALLLGAALALAAAPSARAIYLGYFTTPPAVVWTGSSVVVAADTPGGGLAVWSQPSGGTTWTRQFSI